MTIEIPQRRRLISLEAAVAAVSPNKWAAEQLLKLTTITPSVVANITGGVLQGASADYPVDLYALDFDVGWDDDTVEIEGDPACLGQVGARVDPEFVREVLEAADDA